MKHQTTRSTIFDLHGVPAFNQAFPLALQHVVAMIVGCVTPAIIVSGVAGLSEADSVILIQAALVTSALSTLLQLFPYLPSVFPFIQPQSIIWPAVPEVKITAPGKTGW